MAASAGPAAAASIVAGLAGAALARVRSPERDSRSRANRFDSETELRVGSPVRTRARSPFTGGQGIAAWNANGARAAVRSSLSFLS